MSILIIICGEIKDFILTYYEIFFCFSQLVEDFATGDMVLGLGMGVVVPFCDQAAQF